MNRRLLWLAMSLVPAFAVQIFVTVNRLGPRWVWSSNACGGSTLDGIASTCGIMPAIVPLAALLGAAVYTGGLSVNSWFHDRDSANGDRV